MAFDNHTCARVKALRFPILAVAVAAVVALVLVGCGSSARQAGGSGSPAPSRAAPSPSPSLDPATAAYAQVVVHVNEILSSDQSDWVANCEHLAIAGCKKWVVTDQGVVAQAIATLSAGHAPPALVVDDLALKQALQLSVGDDSALLNALNGGDSTAITAADDKLLKDYTNVQLPAMQAIVPGIQ